jgi:HD superfamily phosphohydrolase
MTSKLFFDPIHGFIELPDYCIKIIDSNYFQQLRYKKQLGATYYIFPGATHNRFEHSIGVSYLAGQLINQLKNNQPELNITDKDVQLIMLAGLLHDVGHGPMSHLFDDILLKSITSLEKTHEYRAGLIIDKLYSENYFDLNKEDVNIIKKYINPNNNDDGFLYEIVSNNRNSLDVDKFDYLMRDTKSVGLSYTIDCSRLILQARVIDNEICYPEKLNFSIYNLFGIRYRLHKEICTHPCVQQIEFMFADVLKSADSYFNITNSIYDINKFIKFNDSIFNTIEFISDPKLDNAKSILNKIRNRNLYKLIGSIYVDSNIKYTVEDFIFFSKILISDDVIVHNSKIGYTNDDINPVDNISFYKQKDLNNKFKLKKENVSQLLPEIFNEKITRFFCRKPELIEECIETFNKFRSYIKQTNLIKND